METLTFIHDFWVARQYGPTYAEVSEALGINLNGALAKIDSLCRQGLLVRETGVHRSLRVTEQGQATVRAAATVG